MIRKRKNQKINSEANCMGEKLQNLLKPALINPSKIEIHFSNKGGSITIHNDSDMKTSAIIPSSKKRIGSQNKKVMIESAFQEKRKGHILKNLKDPKNFADPQTLQVKGNKDEFLQCLKNMDKKLLNFLKVNKSKLPEKEALKLEAENNQELNGTMQSKGLSFRKFKPSTSNVLSNTKLNGRSRTNSRTPDKFEDRSNSKGKSSKRKKLDSKLICFKKSKGPPKKSPWEMELGTRCCHDHLQTQEKPMKQGRLVTSKLSEEKGERRASQKRLVMSGYNNQLNKQGSRKSIQYVCFYSDIKVVSTPAARFITTVACPKAVWFLATCRTFPSRSQRVDQ
jgi:hypothetical protein